MNEIGICIVVELVYPKVKVRQEEEEEEDEFQRIYLKDFKSPSLYHHHHHPSNSKSPERKHGYTPPHVRVPISGSGRSGPNISSTATKFNKNIAEVITAKPASVLPPRAVLSSPENDAMLGTKNNKKTVENRQNTHNKCNKTYQLHKRSNTKSSWK